MRVVSVLMSGLMFGVATLLITRDPSVAVFVLGGVLWFCTFLAYLSKDK